MKETTDIMAMLQKMDIHKIVDGLGGGYGNYMSGDYSGLSNKVVQQMMDDLKVWNDTKILTIANPDKLKGALGYYGGSQWEVSEISEYKDRYLIKVQTENGLASWDFDLYRNANQFENYDLQYGDRVIGTFTYNELKSPIKLRSTICDILEFTAKNNQL